MAATVTAVALPTLVSAESEASAEASSFGLASASAPRLPSISLSSSTSSTSGASRPRAISAMTSTTECLSAGAPSSTSLPFSTFSKSSSSLPSSSLSIQDRLNELRKQLKAWERDFAAANGGRKAGREDIKADCAFAAKYKEYNALRDQVAGRSKTVSGDKKEIWRMREESARRDGGRKMGSEEDGARSAGHGSSWSTPRKNRKIKSKKMFMVTKVEGTGKGDEENGDEIQEAEANENQGNQEHQNLATPSRTRAMLGPTPQKDGVVLGLFDLLSPSVGVSSKSAVGAEAGSITTAAMTPSKGDRSRLREITGNSTASFQAMTPRKNRYGAFGGIGANGENIFNAAAAAADDVGDDFVNRKGSRTPTSAGKRFLLDSFVTPRKRRRYDGASSADATPSSAAKRFMTPQFLRREAPVLMEALVEDDGDNIAGTAAGAGAGAGDGLDGLDIRVGLPSRARQPWKRKGLVRSLSSMIQGLRKQEDDRLDEEMDIMNDFEGEDTRTSSLKEKKNMKKKTGDADENEAMMVVAESQIASTLDADGLVSLAEDKNQTAAGEGDVAVPARKKKGQKRQTRRVILRPTKVKTKQAESRPAAPSEDEDEVHAGSGSGEKNINHKPVEGNKTTRTTTSGSVSNSAPGSKGAASKTKSEDTKSGKGKRVRKVSEQAHANYRRLKIKSKLSKGGGKGRFGRGRR